MRNNLKRQPPKTMSNKILTLETTSRKNVKLLPMYVVA